MEQNKNNTKRKKHKHILWKDRIIIEQMLKKKCKTAEIARVIECTSKTIKREIERGSWEKLNSDLSKTVVYSADTGQLKHEKRAKNKGKYAKITNDHKLREFLETKIIKEKYSPEAALQMAKRENFEVAICVKTVYNCIDSGEIAVKRTQLPRKRSWRKINQQQYKSYKNIKGESIENRPIEANERSEKGHWEGDLVVGKKGTKQCLLTLTDRMTKREIIRKIPDKTQKSIENALKKINIKTLDFKTITFDNGSEFLDFEMIEKVMKCRVFYAHPYCSFERGTNENANGIIRRFLPKGTDFSQVSQKEVRKIERWMNNYPRKILGWKTALEYEKLVA